MKKTLTTLAIAIAGTLTACQSPTPILVQNTPPPQAQSQSAPKAMFYNTAKDGLWRAQIEARRWDSFARLSKIEARWVDENGRSYDWVYYFTATRKDRAYKVEGSRGQEVSDFYHGTIYESSIRIDSDKAVELAKAKGLDRFPLYSMELDNFMRWELRSSSGTFFVDARSGSVSK